MKPLPCFTPSLALEETARVAEQRRHQALDALMRKLGPPAPMDPFEQAMRDLIDADHRGREAIKKRKP